MKKILGFVFLAAFALVLTGCGKGNVLTCTKDGEKVEVTFSGNKVTKVAATTTLDSEEEAKSYESLAKLYVGEDVKIKRSGKKITMTMSGAALEDEDEYTGTKADVKKAAEEDGYKCK